MKYTCLQIVAALSILIMPFCLGELILRQETKCGIMDVDSDGMITSLFQKQFNNQQERELLRAKGPFIKLEMNDKKLLDCTSAKYENGILTFEFPEKGTVAVRTESKWDYFKFSIASIDVENVARIMMPQALLECSKYFGEVAGIVSDDKSAVCLRALMPEVTAGVGVKIFGHFTTPAVGQSIAMVIGPKAELRNMLKQVAEGEHMPGVGTGGPYSTDTALSRLSYLFVGESFTDVEAWTEYARRGGYGILHFREPWFTANGDYRPSQTFFPGGIRQFTETAERIHAAGLKLGLHTLSGGIGCKSRNIAPEAPDGLDTLATYTLAKDFSATDDALYVNELPITSHSLSFTYHGASNAIKIGSEIIQYSEISREKPYAFLKCSRGAFGTVVQEHKAGDKADYLRQAYMSFFPKTGTRLMESISDDIVHAVNAAKADFIYFDGLEGLGGSVPEGLFCGRTEESLKGIMAEMSCRRHYHWWYHSRFGAWDSPNTAHKQFHDNHVSNISKSCQENMIGANMGWWHLTRNSKYHYRRQFLDETEYFAAKNFAMDASNSLSGITVGQRPNHDVMEMLTVLGWYEKMRLAKYFDAETIARVAEPQKDFRLRLDREGHWRFTPVALNTMMLEGNADCELPAKSPKADLRIELLQSFAKTNGHENAILSYKSADEFKARSCAWGVSQEVSNETKDVRGGSVNLRIKAENKNSFDVGAWSCCGMDFPYPYKNFGAAKGFGLWVKGDGSGAILNLQFMNPPEFGGAVKENYVKLDFKGWRFIRFALRESFSDEAFGLKWPYVSTGAAYNVAHNVLDVSKVSRIAFWLNKLPANGGAEVTIGPVQELQVIENSISNGVLKINGDILKLPATVTSGDVLEFHDGMMTQYDIEGNIIAQCQVALAISSKNRCKLSISGKSTDELRAKVTLFELGEPFGKRNASVDWNWLKYEYDMPRHITRFDGKENAWEIIARDEDDASPNDSPKLELEIRVESLPQEGSSVSRTLVETFDKVEDFTPSEWNDSDKFATDGLVFGVAPGVQRSIKQVPGNGRKSKALLFTADTSDAKSGNWAAIGKRFKKPLDLSKAASLGLFVLGHPNGETLKMQLWDTNGQHQDFIRQVDFNGWKFINFKIDDTTMDLSSVEYVMFYYNGLAIGGVTACALDGLIMSTGSDVGLMAELSINDSTINLPVQLRTKQSFKCTSNGEWTVTEGKRKIASGKFSAPLPLLHKGHNSISLNSNLNGACAVQVLCTKIYD